MLAEKMAPTVGCVYEKRVLFLRWWAAVVVVPTRELCSQTYSVIRKALLPFHWIVPGNVMGGMKKKSEKARLRKGLGSLDFGNSLAHLQRQGLQSSLPHQAGCWTTCVTLRASNFPTSDG